MHRYSILHYYIKKKISSPSHNMLTALSLGFDGKQLELILTAYIFIYFIYKIILFRSNFRSV